MNKRLKSSGAGYWRLKANREENLTICAGSIYTYVMKSDKHKKSNDEKGADIQKKQDW